MRVSTDVFSHHPAARWAVPVLAVAAIAGGTLVATRPASADAGLPPLTAQQLLVELQQAQAQPLSGTVSQTADLGLPSLSGLTGLTGGGGGPAGGGSSSSSAESALTSLLSGTHTWRVWAGSPTQSRLALVDGSNETAVIRNGADVWLWSSADKKAAHTTLTADHPGKPSTPGTAPTDLPRTPQEAATKALAALDPTTAVAVSGSSNVAGRSAYDLVLTPKTPGTRVAQVRIAVDAEKHLPLRVQVYSAKRANPAVDVGFTAVDFTAPDASVFAFTPPSDAQVESPAPSTATPDSHAVAPRDANAKPKVVGSGWAAVAVTKPSPQIASMLKQPEAAQLLSAVPEVSGTWGRGRLVDGTLFSAVVTDDGRVAVGAVAPESLYAALAAS